MTLEELKVYYKNGNQFELKTGLSHTNWYHWFKKFGYIPIKSQFRIEELTGGVLRADINHARRVSVCDTDVEKRIRMYVVDSLMMRVGKELTPDVISELARELVERLADLWVQSNE